MLDNWCGLLQVQRKGTAGRMELKMLWDSAVRFAWLVGCGPQGDGTSSGTLEFVMLEMGNLFRLLIILLWV